MSYTGPFPYTNTGTTSGISATNTSFTGNIGNSGVINGGSVGIFTQTATISGSISNAGVINASAYGIDVENTTGIKNIVNAAGGVIEAATGIQIIAGGRPFSGTVSNAGVILSNLGSPSSRAGIVLAGTGANFTGAVRNGGLIFGQAKGIEVVSFARFGTASAGGGVVNSGAIRPQGQTFAFGIQVIDNSSFAGGVTNSGVIAQIGSAGNAVGIVVGGVSPTALATAARFSTFLPVSASIRSRLPAASRTVALSPPTRTESLLKTGPTFPAASPTAAQ
jgi:hypothetical protein